MWGGEREFGAPEARYFVCSWYAIFIITMTSLAVVCPSTDYPTYFSAEVFAGRGLAGAAYMGDLAAVTVASLARASGLEARVYDESIGPVDDAASADFVGITGKISQRGRMIALAREFRRQGKVVIIGGPYASLSPEDLREHCDVLVRGEIEGIAPEFFGDLRNGTWRDEYVGGRPDAFDQVAPDWGLYPNGRALLATVQTSRGCPFECEFCDVIEYLGRRQRFKSIGAVLGELDQLYALGYRNVFLADDNFTARRSRAKEVLEALRAWNDARPERVQFVTQVSIDAAADEELLRLCAAAGLGNVFVGIETPNEESLREAKKRQNLRGDLVAGVQRFFAHGIAVTGGMIVGFDHDTTDIFERQFDFAERSGVPIFSVGALVAPAATPLHARMRREGRLGGGEEVAALPWSTNIEPLHMTREDLLQGLKWLCNRLYDPAVFAERVVRFVDALEPPAGAVRAPSGGRPIDHDVLELFTDFTSSGPEADAWDRIFGAVRQKPAASRAVAGAMYAYIQARYMFERGAVWEPVVAAAKGPPRRSARSLPLA